MQHHTIYQLDKSDLKEVLADELRRLQNETVFARFRDRLISVATVADMHNVHRDTVVKYAKAQLIPAQHTGRLYKFSLADALQFDFNELRRVS